MMNHSNMFTKFSTEMDYEYKSKQKKAMAFGADCIVSSFHVFHGNI